MRKYTSTPANQFIIRYDDLVFRTITEFEKHIGVNMNAIQYRIKMHRKKTKFMDTSFKLKYKDIEFEVEVFE